MARRLLFKLKIVEHFETQAKFAYTAGIDEGIVSKFYRCTKDPTATQRSICARLLKTRADRLFKKSDG